MALVTYLPSSDYEAMPWRNGAGTTHEIAIDDSSGESKAPFLWRLSMADLAGEIGLVAAAADRNAAVDRLRNPELKARLQRKVIGGLFEVKH